MGSNGQAKNIRWLPLKLSNMGKGLMFSSVRTCHWSSVENTDCHRRQDHAENKLSICLNKYDIHCQAMDVFVQSLWYLVLE